MAFDFDHIIDRRESDSLKWRDSRTGDVLPMWVADMDFASPPCMLQAVCRRAARCCSLARAKPAAQKDLQTYLSILQNRELQGSKELK